ncbi:acetate--CoA ligase family protein [Candidatus Bipolaricaulota bacterium]|nr:acetate--CoA ligase family protein [Candidatus Bipolaricaulota bacterium]
MPRDLTDLLYPRSVAVVGASATPGKIGHALFSNVAGFTGPVYAVNPSHKQILGRPCVPTVADLPADVDLAIIAVPPADALRALDACGRKGIRNAVVITAGFKERRGEGIERERELVRIASAHRMNVLGPNSFGLISPRARLNATFAPRGAFAGTIAFISQSGALGSAVLNWAWQREVGFSFFVSLGNKAVLAENDLLAALARDPETRVIAAYLEGVEDGPEFVRLASEVTRDKPVLVLKAGTTEVGARAAASHTGALAGSDRAYDAAFRRGGVLRVRTVEELLEGAVALSQQPLPRGRRVGIVSNAGGPAILAADAAADEGLELPPLSPGTVASLVERFPAANIANPVDILADASADQFQDAVEWVLADPKVDMGLVLTAPHPVLTFAELARILAAAHRRHAKPVVASFLAGEIGDEAEKILSAAGVSAYFEPARAVRALATLARYREVQDRPPPDRSTVDADRAQARELLGSRGPRLGVESLDLLTAYGIPVARGGVARGPDEAEALAQDLGEEVVLKVVSAEVVHKSDAGGVRIGVPGSGVRDVYREMVRAVPAATGVYVQELLPPGEEVIVGIVRDPTFGPLVMFGLGGVLVEVLEDVAFALAPLSRGEVEELVRSIRGFPLLEGARGRPSVHLPALVEVVERISHLAADFPQIQELDVNPLLCYPDRVVAVDFRATLG